MPTLLRARPKPAIRDLLEGDERVVCTEGFRPNMGQEVERGRYFHLDAPVVQQYPRFFSLAIPLSELIGEIER